MKTFILLATLIASPLTYSAQQSMVCHDSQFGAGHLKVVIPNTQPFFAPRAQKPAALGEFSVRGETFKGVFESPIFMADWPDRAGWYRSRPAPLDFSLCNWKKCPVRKVKLTIYTKDQMKGEGDVKFTLHEDGKDESFDRKLSCEIKTLI